MLNELHFSADLPAETLQQLARHCQSKSFAAGEVIFHEGTASDALYLIYAGKIALEMSIPGRGAVRILTLGPGEMVGWSSLLSEGNMTASAIAIEPTTTVVAPAKTLLEICETNRELGYHLMRRMAFALSRRLVATRLQLLDLFAEVPSSTPQHHIEAPGQ
ncbi:MAG: cyclic nucleotide-binding domain-containing protein [Planctomycetaceae bacterium]